MINLNISKATESSAIPESAKKPDKVSTQNNAPSNLLDVKPLPIDISGFSRQDWANMFPTGARPEPKKLDVKPLLASAGELSRKDWADMLLTGTRPEPKNTNDTFDTLHANIGTLITKNISAPSKNKDVQHPSVQGIGPDGKVYIAPLVQRHAENGTKFFYTQRNFYTRGGLVSEAIALDAKFATYEQAARQVRQLIKVNGLGKLPLGDQSASKQVIQYRDIPNGNGIARLRVSHGHLTPGLVPAAQLDGTLVAKIQAKEVIQAGQRRHIGYVVTEMSSYTDKPLTEETILSGKRIRDADGYFNRSIGNMRLITDVKGQVIGDFEQAKQRVLEMMAHGELTTQTDRQAQIGRETKEREVNAIKQTLSNVGPITIDKWKPPIPLPGPPHMNDQQRLENMSTQARIGYMISVAKLGATGAIAKELENLLKPEALMMMSALALGSMVPETAPFAVGIGYVMIGQDAIEISTGVFNAAKAAANAKTPAGLVNAGAALRITLARGFVAVGSNVVPIVVGRGAGRAIAANKRSNLDKVTNDFNNGRASVKQLEKAIAESERTNQPTKIGTKEFKRVPEKQLAEHTRLVAEAQRALVNRNSANSSGNVPPARVPPVAPLPVVVDFINSEAATTFIKNILLDQGVKIPKGVQENFLNKVKDWTQERGDTVQSQTVSLQILKKSPDIQTALLRDAAVDFITRTNSKTADFINKTNPASGAEVRLLREGVAGAINQQYPGVAGLQKFLNAPPKAQLNLLRDVVVKQMGGDSPMAVNLRDYAIAMKWSANTLVHVLTSPKSRVTAMKEAFFRSAQTADNQKLPGLHDRKFRQLVEEKLAKHTTDSAKESYLKALSNSPETVSGMIRKSGADGSPASSGAISTRPMPPPSSVPKAEVSTSNKSPALKPIPMKIQDVGSKAFGDMLKVLDQVTALPSAAITKLITAFEKTAPLQAIRSSPIIETTGRTATVLADAYRECLRGLSSNPITWNTIGKYQAYVRQARYFPMLADALKVRATGLASSEQAVAISTKIETSVRKILKQSESVVTELQQQTTRLSQANETGDIPTIKDARSKYEKLIFKLTKLQEAVVKVHAPLTAALDAQIKLGDAKLKSQSVGLEVRQQELANALAKSNGVDTPSVLSARKNLNNANAFNDAQKMLEQRRNEMNSTASEFGVDSARASDARLAYEKAKTELGKHTLASNNPLVDVLIDRDASLQTQVDQLKALRSALTLDLLQGVNSNGPQFLDQLRGLQTRSQDMTRQAIQKYNGLLNAEFRVRDDMRIDQVSVSARAGASDIKHELGNIGYLHSKAKDLFDGAGKGRIDGLTNVAKVKKAQTEVDQISAEVSQLRINQKINDARLKDATNNSQTTHNDIAALKLSQLQGQESLTNANIRLKFAQERLNLEQRAADPRQIEHKLADIRSLVSQSTKELAVAEKTYQKNQVELNGKLEKIEADINATKDLAKRSPPPDPSKPDAIREHLANLIADYERICDKVKANDYAIDRARTIHQHTNDLQIQAEVALAQAQQLSGVTPGKLVRDGLRLAKVSLKVSALATMYGFATGGLAADTPAEMTNLLKQMNLPGGEAALKSATVFPNLGGAVLLETVQGTVLAWRVKGLVNDLIVVAQPTVQGRGVLASALLNGGTVGTPSPSIQKGSDGVYLTVDSQKITLAAVTFSSVFHPPGTTAVNFWETVKLEFGTVGLSSRFNSASTNPVNGKKVPMIEMVQSNSIKFPGAVPMLGKSISLPAGIGLAVSVKNSVGLGQLSLVYDPDMGVGQVADRTSTGAMKFDMTSGKVIPEWKAGSQPYGFFGTAIRLEKNYYAKYDTREGGNWIMKTTEPLENVFDRATFKQQGKDLTPVLQRGIDATKKLIPSMDEVLRHMLVDKPTPKAR